MTNKGHLREALRMRGVRSATHIMLYPQLCRLMMELILTQCQQLPPDGVIAHVLLKLISLAKQSTNIASALYNQVSVFQPNFKTKCDLHCYIILIRKLIHCYSTLSLCYE